MTKEKAIKEPFIKIFKRTDIALKYKIIIGISAVVLALVISGVFIAILGYNPVLFFAKVIEGNFKNAIYFKLLIREFVPLLITSLGISVAFKMKFWNIGAEGQFLMGAAISMTFALLIGNSLPKPLGTIVVILMGTLGGGLYGTIVAVCKVKFKTNETLLTLMLNYVALYLVTYFINLTFFKMPNTGFPTFKIIDRALWLTELNFGKFTIDTAFFVGIIMVIFLFVYFKYSKHGYEITVVGDSLSTAKYAGMKVNWVIIRTMFISSAIIGLAGALHLSGSTSSHSLSTGLTSGVGWTGIIVAWLAKLNPLMVGIISFLMAMLEKGCSFARTALNISSAVSDIIMGLILFSVLAFDFFGNYKIVFRKKNKDVTIKNDGAEGDSDQETTPEVGLNKNNSPEKRLFQECLADDNAPQKLLIQECLTDDNAAPKHFIEKLSTEEILTAQKKEGGLA